MGGGWFFSDTDKFLFLERTLRVVLGGAMEGGDEDLAVCFLVLLSSSSSPYGVTSASMGNIPAAFGSLL